MNSTENACYLNSIIIKVSLTVLFTKIVFYAFPLTHQNNMQKLLNYKFSKFIYLHLYTELFYKNFPSL